MRIMGLIAVVGMLGCQLMVLGCNGSYYSDGQPPEFPPASSVSEFAVGYDPTPMETPSAETQSDSSETTSDSGWVECELVSPSEKVILSQDLLASPSNSSTTRICMSANACLDYVNTYAADRDCTLAIGAPSSLGANSTCTKVFPGSQGTCKNAQILTDSEVQDLLSTMASK